ncbi:winged helix-turn-helix transcriptional regulator [Companilactobacillus baiquanensis]|uniref:Winged helix-turn-helix transcriptional regulator n=1 Tax=Companilactobacillus baiquanensis TaxID=2486005 RepID=A0ABW1UTN8_9LACO|nr:helix-turn-helix domain-containing protein [Companilactobacillus baiquanensis]
MYENEFDATMQLIRGKWKIRILYELNSDPHTRFNALQRNLDPVTHKILSEQIQQMINDGLVKRIDFHEQPLHIEYHLTKRGQSLIPVVDAICDWGLANIDTSKLKQTLCN